MNSIGSDSSASSSHPTITTNSEWELALEQLEIEKKKLQNEKKKLQIEKEKLQMEKEKLEIMRTNAKIEKEKIASRERVKMKELELKYGQTPKRRSSSNDSVSNTQYFQNKVKENAIKDHLEVPSWLLTENDIPYHRVSEFHISTEADVQDCFIRELKKHIDAYHVTYLDTRYVSVVQGLSPHLTLIPKPITIAKTHYSGVACFEGLSFLASGFIEFMNPSNRFGSDEQKGQLIALLMKTLQNHVSKTEVVGCLSNFHKIIFMRAKRAPNLKTIYCEITKEFELFGEDTTYEGWKYLFNMLKYNCDEEVTMSPAIEHTFESTIGKGASSYVFAMNNKTIALKLFAPNEETMHTFKNETQTLNTLKGIPGLPEILDIGENYFTMKMYSPLSYAPTNQEMIQLLRILQQAHARKVFHRDVRPENILRHHCSNENNMVLIDWGFACNDDSLIGFAGTANFCASEYGRKFLQCEMDDFPYFARYDCESLVKCFAYMKDEQLKHNLSKLRSLPFLQRVEQALEIWTEYEEKDKAFKDAMRGMTVDCYKAVENYIDRRVKRELMNCDYD